MTTGNLTPAQRDVVQTNIMYALEDLSRNVLFKYAEALNFKPDSKKYTWRKYALRSKTTNHLIEGVQPEGLTYGVTEYSVDVHPEGNFIPFTDEMLEYGIDEQLVIGSELLGEDAKERMASLLNAVVFGGVNVYYAQKAANRAAVVSGTKRVTISDLNKIKTLMRRRKVKPVDGKKYIFLASPEVIGDIKSLSGVNESWIDVEKYQNSVDIIDGEVGSFLGFRFVEYLDVPVYSSNVHGCLVFGKEAFGTIAINKADAKGGFKIIYHGLGSGGSSDALDQKATLAWKHKGFGSRILRDEALLRYEVYSDEPEAEDITDSSRSHYAGAGSSGITPTLTAGTNMTISYVGNCAPGNLIKVTAKAGSGYHLASTVWTTASFVGCKIIEGSATDASILVQVDKDASAVTIVAANAVQNA